jgi:replication factor A1
MDDTELAPHIEELKRALGEEITDEKIKEELKKYFEFGIELNEAKKAVVKKLGGNLNLMYAGVTRKLSEVLPTDKNIELKVKILSINDKTVTVQGTDKQIFYGLLADKTMIRPYTAWNDFQLKKNDVVHINSAYAKDWRGEPQINLGNNTTIKPLEDPELAELDTMSIPTTLPSNEYKIGDLRNGMNNLTISGRVLTVDSRTVTVLDEEKEIFTGKLADDTGKIAYTAWSDHNLKPGEVIKISGAYVRSWRGVPKLNFDERMEIERLPDSKLPTVEELGSDKISRIDNLLDKGGGLDVTVEGTILDVKDGSGLIMRCPECNRVLRGAECMVHGTQTGVPDLRIKAVLDDGSDALMAVFNSDLTTKLLGKTLEECEKDLTEVGPDYLNVLSDELNDILLLHPIRLRGTVTTDDYGAMMICTDFDELVLSEEISERIDHLLKKHDLDDSEPEVL